MKETWIPSLSLTIVAVCFEMCKVYGCKIRMSTDGCGVINCSFYSCSPKTIHCSTHLLLVLAILIWAYVICRNLISCKTFQYPVHLLFIHYNNIRPTEWMKEKPTESQDNPQCHYLFHNLHFLAPAIVSIMRSGASMMENYS